MLTIEMHYRCCVDPVCMTLNHVYALLGSYVTVIFTLYFLAIMSYITFSTVSCVDPPSLFLSRWNSTLYGIMGNHVKFWPFLQKPPTRNHSYIIVY